MSDAIFTATTDAHYQAFAGLVTEYVQWCRERYREHAWFVDRVFGYQSLDAELQALAQAYGPPQGQTLLATHDGQICGAGAYRRLADGSCEMKRLFVPERFQGHGTGRRLCIALMNSAQARGYRLMRLDTGHLFTGAIALYQSLGFRDCAPHHPYPQEFLPFMVFMERPLQAPGALT